MASEPLLPRQTPLGSLRQHCGWLVWSARMQNQKHFLSQTVFLSSDVFYKEIDVLIMHGDVLGQSEISSPSSESHQSKRSVEQIYWALEMTL